MMKVTDQQLIKISVVDLSQTDDSQDWPVLLFDNVNCREKLESVEYSPDL